MPVRVFLKEARLGGDTETVHRAQAKKPGRRARSPGPNNRMEINGAADLVARIMEGPDRGGNIWGVKHPIGRN